MSKTKTVEFQGVKYKNVPAWVKYIAVDADGAIFGYQYPPSQSVKAGYWTNDRGDCWCLNLDTKQDGISAPVRI